MRHTKRSDASIAELTTVALKRDRSSDGLRSGALGTVVGIHGGGDAYEVEFLNPVGRTIAVLTLPASEISAAQVVSDEASAPGATPEMLVQDEMDELERGLRELRGRDPVSLARKTPLESRLAVVRAIEAALPMTNEGFSVLLEDIASSTGHLPILGDKLGLASDQAGAMLRRWRVHSGT